VGDDTSAFEALITGLDYPLYIVTAGSGDDVDGCLVGFATQCSINPPRFIACLSNKNLTTRLAARADALVVHVLHEADRDLAVRFGARTGDETAKLAGCAWSPGPGGAPILDGVDWFAGRIVARHDVGDHVAHVLDVFDGSSGRAASRQLGYQAVRGMAPGHKA
jgi:flavin reductase (DIM6/NTAB) family NADH-FMN oxidoreductase RutF